MVLMVLPSSFALNNQRHSGLSALATLTRSRVCAECYAATEN